MRYLVAIMALLVAIAACSCRSRDDRAAVVQVPELKNEAAAQLVMQALLRTPGVDRESVRIDIKRRRVTLKYDSLNMSLKNVEFAIVMAGFQANDIPADHEAQKALPPEVRGEIIQPEAVPATAPTTNAP